MLRVDSLMDAVETVFGPGTGSYAFRPVPIIYREMATYRIRLTTGGSAFLKLYAFGDIDRCLAEAEGLAAIRATDTIGAPEPLAIGTDEESGQSFMLLSYFEPGSTVRNYWETFGRELAAMHKASTESLSGVEDCPYGFQSDNFVEASFQKNLPMASWVTFFRERRLAPQMIQAARFMDSGTRKKCDKLLERLDDYLTEPSFPSLLHGNLWRENYGHGANGKVWIFNPAVYVGHYEADLATVEPVGRFQSSFIRGYREIIPIEEGYEDRREIYNLYHRLYCLNHYGESFYAGIIDVLNRFV